MQNFAHTVINTFMLIKSIIQTLSFQNNKFFPSQYLEGGKQLEKENFKNIFTDYTDYLLCNIAICLPAALLFVAHFHCIYSKI